MCVSMAVSRSVRRSEGVVVRHAKGCASGEGRVAIVGRAIRQVARELGATVTMEPMDMPIGRFAGFVDPQGPSFAVMQLASQA